MVPPPVIVTVPKDTPRTPGPPPQLPPQSGPAVAPPQTAQQVPPPPPRKKKNHHKNSEETQAASNAVPAQNAQQPAPQPAAQPVVTQLSPVLTDDQRRDYEAHIRDALDSATRNLGSVANHQLSNQQETMRTQVVSFINQAQEARKTDLVTARSLAERANLLSQDLRDSLQ